mmetsp:Transcript_19571/g.49148  ORF Transcript_19571/g.49148 Transcript_19571/m.49148 type:complete len:83 (+) Transcript_19571:153-401(+)
MGVLSDLLQTAVSAPGSRGPNISQFLGHDSSAQLKLSAATDHSAVRSFLASSATPGTLTPAGSAMPSQLKKVSLHHPTRTAF